MPVYLCYLRAIDDECVSVAKMARGLDTDETMVRKDLEMVCSQGEPKIGYPRRELVVNLEGLLGVRDLVPVVVAGAGQLGQALMHYSGFEDFGLRIVACFDADHAKLAPDREECPVLPVERMARYCRDNNVRLGVIAVPESAAQRVCDQLIEGGVKAVWNFAPCPLKTPKGVIVRYEDLTLSLARIHIYLASERRGGPECSCRIG